MWRQKEEKEKNILCATTGNCFFVTYFLFERPQSSESVCSFLMYRVTSHGGSFLFKICIFSTNMPVCSSQSLSVPLAEVTHLFCLKVNVGQSPPIAKKSISHRKKQMCRQHYDDSSTDVHSNLFCRRWVFSVSLPLNPSGSSLETMEHLASEKGRKWQGRVTFPPRSSDAVGFLLHSLTAACCVGVGFFLYWRIAPCVPGLL